MKLAVLSNINIDIIKERIVDTHLFENDDIYVCGYGQYLIEFINKESYINTNKVDYIFLHLDGKELLKDSLYSLESTDEYLIEIDNLLDNVSIYLSSHRDTIILLSSIIFPPFSFKTYIENPNIESIDDISNRVNQKIKNFIAENAAVLHYDFRRLVLTHGYQEMYDDKYWYLGRMKYSPKGLKYISQELINLVQVHRGSTKKVLILDLDNTLWGGVIGEDNLEGIKLSEDGIGKVYRDFQYTIKALKELGILLAICSKNNEGDALEVFSKHNMCVLKENDFIIKKINWQTKVENIKEIAAELNLGLNSFVFIDDNPVERNLVKENLPDVEVPEFPKDITSLQTWFLSEVVYRNFAKLSYTQEDSNKTRQYENNIERSSLKKTLDMHTFVESLKIKLKVLINDKKHIERTAQLTQKTNQFNLTTKRYTEKDIDNFLNSPEYNVYLLTYMDKFGNEGIVGEIIIDLTDKIPKIDLFLMSCRVIGRGVEYSFIAEVLTHLKSLGYKDVSALYIETKKNPLVKDLYDKCGFNFMGDHYYNSIDVILEKNLKNLYKIGIEL